MAARTRLTGKHSDFTAIVLTAAARGDLQDVKSLVHANPAWVQRVGSHGRTMLWEAAYKGHHAVVEYLIGCGADLNRPGCYYTPMLSELSPRSAAILKKHTPVANLLEKSGAWWTFTMPVTWGMKRLSTRPFSKTGLSCPCPKNTPPICKPHCQSSTPWPESSPQSSKVSWGMSPTNWDADLKELARRHGHEVDLNAPDWQGFPALVDACRGNHNQPDDPLRVRALLAAGADVHSRDSKGKTALHRAAQAGFTKIPALFLQSGAKVNEQDSNGETAVYDAIRGRHTATVALLLQAEAKVHTRNHRGKTPLDIATRLLGPEREAMLELVGRGQS